MKRYATICSGIGAPEVAADLIDADCGQKRWQCIFSSEIEAFPNAVRSHHWPGIPNLGDMTRFKDWPHRCDCKIHVGIESLFKLNGHEIEITLCRTCGGIRIDVLIGGTPCQSFSVAGLRKGQADPRGNLALTFLAITLKYLPSWVLWENVPGVHSSWSDEATFAATEESKKIIDAARQAVVATGLDPGTSFGAGEFEEADQSNDFDCFLAGLEELGYGAATRILDAQYFGVAQRRRRPFVIGHIGGLWQRSAAVLFERESLRGDSPPSREKGQGIAGTFKAGAASGGWSNSADHAAAGYMIPEITSGYETAPLMSNGCGKARTLTVTADSSDAIPLQEIGNRQSGTPMNGVGHGQPGDPMFTLQSTAVHGVAQRDAGHKL